MKGREILASFTLESSFGLLGRLSQTPQCRLVLEQVHALGRLGVPGEPIHDDLVEVVTAQVSGAAGGQLSQTP